MTVVQFPALAVFRWVFTDQLAVVLAAPQRGTRSLLDHGVLWLLQEA